VGGSLMEKFAIVPKFVAERPIFKGSRRANGAAAADLSAIKAQ
jgi:hypothetical protein